MEIINSKDIINSNKAITYGRNYLNEYGYCLEYVCSGLKVLTNGTYVKFNVYSSDDSFMSLFVNDEYIKRIKLIHGKNVIKIDSLINNSYVKLLKESEASSSLNSIINIETDGNFLESTESHKYKIEVYGDSITSGFGNLVNDPLIPFSAEISDGTKTYISLALNEIDCFFNIISYSGYGLYTSRWSNINVTEFFDKYSERNTNKYNHDEFKPDLVIINLGTNDIQQKPNDNNPDMPIFNKDDYYNAYKNYINKIFDTLGEKTKIICCIGIMKTDNQEWMYDSIKNLEKNYKNVYSLIFNNLSDDEYGSCYHPNLKAHKLRYKVMLEKINEVLNV